MSRARPPGAPLVEATLDRLLALDPEARSILAEIDDAALEIVVEGTGLAWRIEIEDGRARVGAPPAEESAAARTVRVRGAPLGLARLAATLDDEDADPPPNVSVTGDLGVLRRFRRVARRLDLDWEEPLARLIGDAAAHELGRAARGLLGWARGAGDSLLADLGEYLSEEARVTPTAPELDSFAAGTDAVRDDVERLEKRLDLLEERLARGKDAS